MTTTEPCRRCGAAPLPGAPFELCPGCLLLAALEDNLPREFGRYTLQRLLGEGGMGQVYAAFDPATGRTVALKRLRAGTLASPRELARFHAEVRTAARLEHPGIIGIHEVGEEDGVPYFTMRLVSGETLERHLARFRTDHRSAAALMAKVARAVHHGHLRGVLHRDLKPANILLDGDVPLVADFGIARRLDDGDATVTLGLLGTPAYMSPEQAGAGESQLTTRSDVYSLGAMLFQLLTGRVPYEGLTAADLLARQRTMDVPRLRDLNAAVDPVLEAICLKCLERTPEQRYSADELADDLERWVRDEATTVRPEGPVRRLGRWAKGHPGSTHGMATGVLLASALAFAAVGAPRLGEQQRRSKALQDNASDARALAGLVLFELQQLAVLVDTWSRDDLVRARLEGPLCGGFPPELERRHADSPFVTIGLWNAAGLRVARHPLREQDPACGAPFDWTDYFQGAAQRAKEGRSGAYLGRASRSEVTGEDKFTLAAPVKGPDGALRGVLYGSVAMDSMLAKLKLDLHDDPNTTAALIARRDGTRETRLSPLPDDWVVLVHRDLPRGHTRPVASRALARLPPSDRAADQFRLSRVAPVLDDDYRDGVPGFEGRWLAAFAPVGQTDYTVMVQTRDEAATDSDTALAARLALWAGLPFAALGLVLNLLLRRLLRRSP